MFAYISQMWIQPWLENPKLRKKKKSININSEGSILIEHAKQN